MGLLTRALEENFVPTPGGLLDGLPKADQGSSYAWLMGLDNTGNKQEPDGSNVPAVQDSVPRAQELRDNSHNAAETDKSSASGPQGEEIAKGDDKIPPHSPREMSGGDRGSIAGKIWNSPNSATGMAYGGLGYLAGWPMHWLGLQDRPGITTGNNAVQFTDNPFIAPDAAITIGNAEVFGPREKLNGRDTYGLHEEQHTYQGEQLGPFYLPSNIFGGAAGELIDGNWHGQHNWNEVGPNQPRPVPWPR
jgi:hypothetical protein